MLKRNIFFIVFFFLNLNIAVSQQTKYVDGNRIKEYISIIASDEYEGRETGMEGCIKTENYFAEKFKSLGLKPAGENNSFFQTYSFPFYRLAGNFELIIGDRKFYFGADEDFDIAHNSEGGSAEGNIVYAGYGINAPNIGRDDYKDIDIKNKIVVIKRGAPEEKADILSEYASDSAKATFCFKYGAKGILFYESPVSRNSPILFSKRIIGGLPSYARIKNFPIFNVEYKVIRKIFDESSRSLKSSHRSLEKNPVSFETNISAKMSADIIYDPDKKTRNVIAMIPGSDSKLKKEAIIIGGHMDHLGKKYDGSIYNGADDNASGVCVTLGIAEAMIKNKFRPKRTIIFACWSGEEKGIFGSEAWVKNPTWDLNNIVIYFNLDMVGLGDGKLNLPGTYFADKVWNYIKDNVDTSYLNKVNPSKGGLGGSDHNPFLKAGVPAFAGMTSGSHPEYHQPEDDAEKIDASILQTTGDFIYRSTELLSQEKQSFINPDRSSENRFKLMSIRNLTTISPKNCGDLFTNKNISFSLIDFGDDLDNLSPENNFINILNRLDSLFNAKSETGNNVYIKQFSSDRGKETVSLMPAMNLSKINFNKVYSKVLFDFGLKIGIIDDIFFNKNNVEEKTNLIRKISGSGLALLINTPTAENIMLAAQESKKSLGIIVSNPTVIDDKLFDVIKSNNHLFIYKFNVNDNTDSIVNSIKMLRDKLNENQISLTADKFDNQSYSKLKEIFFRLDKEKLPEDFMMRLFGNNFVEFMVRTTNVTQEIRGRR